MPLKRTATKKKATPKKKSKLIKRTIEDGVDAAIAAGSKRIFIAKPNWEHVATTGSTLLDLNISGGRVEGGGIPGGVMVEIYGPPGLGKTALAVAIGAGVQAKGGNVQFLDPEARMDKDYAEITGLLLSDASPSQYSRPDTVKELFNDNILKWPDDNKMSAKICDGMAALSTELEMGEKGDKMGAKRAKDFSEGCRKAARVISAKNKLVVFTNQLRQKLGVTVGSNETTPGGKAIPYYSSIRMRVGAPPKLAKVTQVKKINGREVTRIIGLRSEVVTQKCSVDNPFRHCYIYIMFGYGIDDIRGNLAFCKGTLNESTYTVKGMKKSPNALEKAVELIEQGDLEEWLRSRTINLWHEIENKFKKERKKKVFF